MHDNLRNEIYDFIKGNEYKDIYSLIDDVTLKIVSHMDINFNRICLLSIFTNEFVLDVSNTIMVTVTFREDDNKIYMIDVSCNL